ncbi:MAG: pseudouridine synthase [Opitutales bacterium]
MHPEKIGFPPPLLGEAPERLQVFRWSADDGLLILEKPAGVLVDPHPWYPASPSLVAALARQVDAAKPELAPFGFERVHGVGVIDAEIEGAALIAANHQAGARWRDAYGSGQVEWVFECVARSFESPQKALGKKGGTIESAHAFECRLPLVGDPKQARTRVSHRFGKQARTRFQRLEPLSNEGGWSLWKARTSYHRPHQLRLHALESGLRIAGESLYLPDSSETDPTSKPNAEPGGPLMRLSEIVATPAGERPGVHCQVPASKAWLRRVKALTTRNATL